MRTIWYTRCPVPTASGIAIQRGIFDELFAGTGFEVRNIRERGDDAGALGTHYDHSLPDSVREGGGSPPVWARSRGADTRLVGVSFVEETLGIFVRRDDPIETVRDLAGRRIALPVWPGLAINFFRFAALKAFDSALKLHGLSLDEVVKVDVVESSSHFDLLNPAFARGERRTNPSYYHEQREALLAGRVDAIFAKGGEIAAMLASAGDRIRLLYDLRDAEPLWARVNNATPRLLTFSGSLVREAPEAVVLYVRALLRAARWAEAHPREALEPLARETGVSPEDIARYYTPDLPVKLRPALTPELLGTVEVMKSFLLEHGFIDRDFDLAEWTEPGLLAEAWAAEGLDTAAAA